MTAIVSAPNGAEPGQVTPVPAKHSLNMWSVAAMGIGSMVGAGIFALLGQVAITAGGQTWLAFAAGGLIALTLTPFARVGIPVVAASFACLAGWWRR